MLPTVILREGMRIMKKAIVSIAGIAAVVILVAVSAVFFYGSGEEAELTPEQEAELQDMQEERELESEMPDQDPDAESEALAEQLNVDARQVVSVGKPIKSGIKEITVKSWKMTKEQPEYAPAEGEDLSPSGAEFDENGTITNGYSYVLLDVAVKNTRQSQELSDYIWGYMRLQIAHHSDFLGEIDYIGQDPPRTLTKDYYKETIQPNETAEAALIFIVPDDIMEGESMYMEINPTGGGADIAPETRRYVALKVETYDEEE